MIKTMGMDHVLMEPDHHLHANIDGITRFAIVFNC
jgi:hypothetical protein